MNTQQSTHNKLDGQHAIVIGGSMAGLLAARVLSDHFEQVTIIERDRLPQEVAPRKGVPQGQHVHALLAKGIGILTELFPGLFETLTQNGAIRFTPTDIKFYQLGAWNARFPSSIHLYSQSRPFLEQHVRDFLAVRGNVRFLDGCEVTNLYEDHGRITGVHLRYRNEECHGEILFADLIVDASGRGSQTPQWLVALGYDRVEETNVKVNVGYATRIYRLPSHTSIDWKLLMIAASPPHGRRAGAIFLIEGDRWMVTLTSLMHDYLPDDEVGFLEYARSLPQPDLYEAIKEAEPLTPIRTYRYSANRWRHYERMSRLPEGFVILGDAVCSFNPAYGQGMTVAALEAKVLDTCLQQQQRRANEQGSGFTLRFQKAIAKVVVWPWQMATGVDRRYLATAEEQTWVTRLTNWYILRISQLLTSDPLVADRFSRVAHLLKPPTALFDPRIVWAVLRKELAVRRQKPTAPSRTGEVIAPLPTPEMDAVAR